MNARKLSGNLLAGAGLLALLSGAAFAQQQEQTPQATGQALQPAEAVSQGAPAYFSPTVVRQLQQQLNEAGYAPGNVDGVWGPETADALANFQRDQGLDPTGTLTFETLQVLGLEDVSGGQAAGAAGTPGQAGQVPTAAGAAAEQEETEQQPQQQ